MAQANKAFATIAGSAWPSGRWLKRSTAPRAGALADVCG